MLLDKPAVTPARSGYESIPREPGSSLGIPGPSTLQLKLLCAQTHVLPAAGQWHSRKREKDLGLLLDDRMAVAVRIHQLRNLVRNLR